MTGERKQLNDGLGSGTTRNGTRVETFWPQFMRRIEQVELSCSVVPLDSLDDAAVDLYVLGDQLKEHSEYLSARLPALGYPPSPTVEEAYTTAQAILATYAARCVRERGYFDVWLGYGALGAALRAVREDAKLSQRALADLLSVSQSYISQIEQGTSSGRVPIETVVDWCTHCRFHAQVIVARDNIGFFWSERDTASLAPEDPDDQYSLIAVIESMSPRERSLLRALLDRY